MFHQSNLPGTSSQFEAIVSESGAGNERNNSRGNSRRLGEVLFRPRRNQITATLPSRPVQTPVVTPISSGGHNSEVVILLTEH